LQSEGLSAEDAHAIASCGLHEMFSATLAHMTPAIEELRAGRYALGFGLTAYGGGIPEDLSAQWQAEEAGYEQTCKLLTEWILFELAPMLKAAGIAAAECPVSAAQLASLLARVDLAGTARVDKLSRAEARAALERLVMAESDKR
jgi:Asp-tRNA(Asn)/Glu-tRNA(Gln) amidotransferase B subunit